MTSPPTRTPRSLRRSPSTRLSPRGPELSTSSSMSSKCLPDRVALVVNVQPLDVILASRRPASVIT
eukprot:7279371-Heterocapsa_arctica.AAC.1